MHIAHAVHTKGDDAFMLFRIAEDLVKVVAPNEVVGAEQIPIPAMLEGSVLGGHVFDIMELHLMILEHSFANRVHAIVNILIDGLCALAQMDMAFHALSLIRAYKGFELLD